MENEKYMHKILSVKRYNEVIEDKKREEIISSIIVCLSAITFYTSLFLVNNIQDVIYPTLKQIGIIFGGTIDMASSAILADIIREKIGLVNAKKNILAELNEYGITEETINKVINEHELINKIK